MRNKTLHHALACLTHPLSVAAVAVLLLNAMVWQRTSPSWWTGKIGDAAALLFTPFLIAALLAWLAPPRHVANQPIIGAAAVVITGGTFSLLKTIPALNAFTVQSLATLGYPIKLQLDPTDLLAMPSLLAAWWIWKRGSYWQPSALVRWAMAAMAVLAIMADQPAGRNEDYGFNCLVERGDTIFAVHSWTRKYQPGHAFFRSDDGGLTWNGVPDLTYRNVECKDFRWPISDPNDPNVQYSNDNEYHVVSSGKGSFGIYRSEDAGETFKLVKKTAYICDATLHKPTGNIVLAIGRDGILVHTPEGNWQTTLKPERPSD